VHKTGARKLMKGSMFRMFSVDVCEDDVVNTRIKCSED
jgi:hypothetical protein